MVVVAMVEVASATPGVAVSEHRTCVVRFAIQAAARYPVVLGEDVEAAELHEAGGWARRFGRVEGVT